jgi:hypothetical protein
VQFFEARVVGTVTPHSCLSEEVRNQIWYQSQELDCFRKEARNLCRDIRDQKTDQSANSQEESVSSRGLEQRVCKKRQRSKAVAVRCIIKAQNRNRDPEFIAMVSGKCTVWAREIAAIEASRDYCAVYHPHLLPGLPKTDSIEELPFPIVKKRSAEDSAFVCQYDSIPRVVRPRRCIELN